MPACAFDPAAPYLTAMVAAVDCRSLALGADGYRALGPGSGFGLALSGLVAIFIALIGYRLLLGERLGLRDAVLAGLRIGIVIALATSWSAYRPLVYDLVTQTPEALAAALTGEVGAADVASATQSDVASATQSDVASATQSDVASATPSDVASATMPTVARAQAVVDVIGALIRPATPADVRAPALPSPGDTAAGPAPDAARAGPAVPDMPLPVAATLARAAQILTLSALAGVLSVRVVAAILLAVGPLFAAFLLFEATWGLFAGWVRALVGAALGAMAVPLVLAVETAILAPQVAALGARLAANEAVGMLPEDILSTAAVFALVTLAALVGMARVALGFHLPVPRRGGGAAAPGAGGWALAHSAGLPIPGPPLPPPTTRAEAIAATVARMDARSGRAGDTGGGPPQGRRTAAADALWRSVEAATGRGPAPPSGVPRRPPTPDESRAARRRDDSR